MGLGLSLWLIGPPQNLEDELRKVNVDDIKYFSFAGIKTYARVVSVYDGDSVELVWKYKNEFIRNKTHLCGMRTPEIRTKNLKEKEEGFKAKARLQELVENKIVKVVFSQFDNFGKPLVTLYDKDWKISINEQMVKEGFAEVYTKRKKLN